MRKIKYAVLLTILLSTLPLSVPAQRDWVVRGGCIADSQTETGVTRGLQRRLPSIRKDWDPSKTYYQMVILVSFSDVDFQMEDPQATYDSIFNCNGYNQRLGKGCVAEYFRDQSDGQFNLEFDVYGPIKVDSKAQPYANPTESIRNYGTAQFTQATKQAISDNPDVDYSIYDWNGDKYIEQVIYVYAGYGGNQTVESYGYIWPNTGSMSTITTPDKIKISNYSSSAELWINNKTCGIGTICHEYSHSLGLPDIYPTIDGAGYSVVDEWDLMDGGNFTNFGWCPPNYTALEKMLLGWGEPIELTEPETITDLKPSAEGGEIYQLKHSDDEWLLLENRQNRGWDLGAPGRGLVIYHVVYEKSKWSGNVVNNDKTRRRFDLVHADNMNYEAWDAVNGGKMPWVNRTDRLNNRYLSTSPYPWTTDSTAFVNRDLTDTSVPATVMFTKNTADSNLLSKDITNITMSEDGLISFDVMGGAPSRLAVVSSKPSGAEGDFYNLQGQRVAVPKKGFYIKGGKKYLFQ